MTNELKPYEKIKEYTVNGKPYDEGLEDLYLYLQATASIDYTIYVDIETGDIGAMPSCNFGNAYDNINKAIFKWKVDGGESWLGEVYTYDELEDYASEEDVKELRKEFEKEHKDELDGYENIEDFYNDFADDYKRFLFYAENKDIDKGVDEFARESLDSWKEDFENAYCKLLEDYELREELEDY